MKIKYLHYNIAACRNYENSGSSPVNEGATLEAIRAFDADIITLNEVDENTKRSGNVNQPEYLSKELGMNYYFAPAIELTGGHYGIALFSKFDIVSAKMVRIPDCYDKNGNLFERRVIISAVLNVEGKQLRVMMSHYGLSHEEQVNAVECTLNELHTSNLPTVFSGDLNMTPDNSLIAKISENMKDSACLLEKEQKTFPSWADDTSEDSGIKIDYVFTSGDISATKAEVPHIRVSDHRPYYCELEF